MRSFIVPDFNYSHVSNLKCAIPVQPSDAAEFMIHMVHDRDQKEIQIIGSDVSLLFRIEQMRKFEGLDVRNISELYDRLRKANVDETAGMSDDKILQYIKSRYIQTPAEVEGWLKHIDANIENIIDDARRAEEIKAAAAAAAESADSSVSVITPKE